MELKSFSEFVASISNEERDYISGANTDDNDHLIFNLSDPNAGNEIAAFIAGYCFGMTLRTLELYHGWISKQLDQPLEH